MLKNFASIIRASSTVPPKWRVEPVDVSAVVGDSIVFDCQAEGYPQPLIRWKKASGKWNCF